MNEQNTQTTASKVTHDTAGEVDELLPFILHAATAGLDTSDLSSLQSKWRSSPETRCDWRTSAALFRRLLRDSGLRIEVAKVRKVHSAFEALVTEPARPAFSPGA